MGIGIWPFRWKPSKKEQERVEEMLTWFGPQKPLEEPMFLLDDSKEDAIVQGASISFSRVTGRRFIKLELLFADGDTAVGYLGRMPYTNYVLRYGLGQTMADEDHNIARLVGARVKIRWEHHQYTGQDLVSCYPVEILR